LIISLWGLAHVLVDMATVEVVIEANPVAMPDQRQHLTVPHLPHYRWEAVQVSVSDFGYTWTPSAGGVIMAGADQPVATVFICRYIYSCGCK